MSTKFYNIHYTMEDEMKTPYHLEELEECGIQTQKVCLLCNMQDESRAHLFFNSLYTRTILLSLTKIEPLILAIDAPSHPNTFQP